ncbi:MAG: hypothetical protein KAV82_08200 [Phycisphaerae bacterium]|nr:hypothetical protein [Phycisphaerae bacterium]
MNDGLFKFVPSVFYKVLTATLGLVLLGWIGSWWFYGQLAPRDIIGSLICTPIFAYLIHLWIVMNKNSNADC